LGVADNTTTFHPFFASAFAILDVRTTPLNPIGGKEYEMMRTVFFMTNLNIHPYCT